MPLGTVEQSERTTFRHSCLESSELTFSIVGKKCVMNDLSEAATCGLFFAGSTASSPYAVLVLIHIHKNSVRETHT